MSKKRKTIKIILIVVFAALLSASVFALYMWNLPHIDVQKEEVDYTLHASALVNEYLVDEKSANEKYLGNDGNSKILLVSGNISNKSEDMNHQTIILLKTAKDKAGVKCVFTPESSIHAVDLKLGQDVQIKGIIRSGAAYDSDLELYENVLLEKCDVAQSHTNWETCGE